VSVLSLAIPISVQSLVNTVTFGVLTQPLFVLSLVLLGLLLISGTLKALRVYVLELFQRQFYARTTSDIALRILNSDHLSLKKENGEELTNRYFDVMTVQKKATVLLTDGLAFVLQTVVGLVLLGFYHPYFLAFDLILIGLIYFVIVFFGKDAIDTAIYESKAKYEVADWLHEMARVDLYFKSKKRKEWAIRFSDKLINKYLNKRSRHFRELFTQTVILLIIYALMSALTLGLGGYLVIDGQLTLGQLVAAELVVTVILTSFAKMGKYLESFYDLCAAIEKISKFYEIPLEENELPEQVSDLKGELHFKSLKYENNGRSYSFDYKFEEGKVYYLSTILNSSKVVCMDLVAAIIKPMKGDLLLGGVTYDEINPLEIRDQIYILSKPNLYRASLDSNIHSTNCSMKNSQVDEALEVVGLSDLHEIFEDGLDHIILSSGYPLWSSQMLRLEVSKALLSDAKIIVFTEIFDTIEKKIRERIIKHAKSLGKTVLVFSNKSTYDYKFDTYLSLEKDGFKEYNSPEEIFEARK
jgi:ABC-type bacteriocin/lantibiotic exporter with double-glycine peptidase domain